MKRIVFILPALLVSSISQADYSVGGKNCVDAAKAIQKMTNYAASSEHMVELKDTLRQLVEGQMTYSNPEYQFLVNHQISGKNLSAQQKNTLAKVQEVFRSFRSSLENATYTSNNWSYGGVNLVQRKYEISAPEELSATYGTGSAQIRICAEDSDAQRSIGDIGWMPRPTVCATFDLSMPKAKVEYSVGFLNGPGWAAGRQLHSYSGDSLKDFLNKDYRCNISYDLAKNRYRDSSEQEETRSIENQPEAADATSAE